MSYCRFETFIGVRCGQIRVTASSEDFPPRRSHWHYGVLAFIGLPMDLSACSQNSVLTLRVLTFMVKGVAVV